MKLRTRYSAQCVRNMQTSPIITIPGLDTLLSVDKIRILYDSIPSNRSREPWTRPGRLITSRLSKTTMTPALCKSCCDDQVEFTLFSLDSPNTFNYSFSYCSCYILSSLAKWQAPSLSSQILSLVFFSHTNFRSFPQYIYSFVWIKAAPSHSTWNPIEAFIYTHLYSIRWFRMSIFKSRSLAGAGYVVLNVIRAMNIIALLAVVASSSVMLVRMFNTRTFFFFDACENLIRVIISGKQDFVITITKL